MLSDKLFELREKIGETLSDEDLAVLIESIAKMDRCENRLKKAVLALTGTVKFRVNMQKILIDEMEHEKNG